MPPFCKDKGQKLSKRDPEIPYSRNLKMHTHTHAHVLTECSPRHYFVMVGNGSNVMSRIEGV